MLLIRLQGTILENSVSSPGMHIKEKQLMNDGQMDYIRKEMYDGQCFHNK